MMHTKSQTTHDLGKLFMRFGLLILCVSALAGCSTNAATGKRQFAGLMSPEQEKKIGAEEHVKIIRQYGIYEDKNLQDYVSTIGARVSEETERPDVDYKFYLLDSPIVNAFALPGGYIYVSRGLLALANSEAELAGVLAHETGHITGRHSAERYSRSVVTSVGATILSVALQSSAASQAISTGTNLYLSGYSRSQENEADSLGLRYLSHGGYEPAALSSFLESLGEEKLLAQKKIGKSQSPVSYLSTHPPTPERVQKTSAGAGNYAVENAVDGRDRYLNKINGITYGDSAKQGFTRNSNFYHPELGFTFTAPKGYTIINQPQNVVAKSNETGAVMIFDFGSSKTFTSNPSGYLANEWMRNEQLGNVERIKVNGLSAATASFPGQVNNRAVTIQLVAIQWGDGRYARFQIAIPSGLNKGDIDALKSASYSFRGLSNTEKKTLKPKRIKIITAQFGDTPRSLGNKQAVDTFHEDHFRVLNGLGARGGVQSGRRYKLIVE